MANAFADALEGQRADSGIFRVVYCSTLALKGGPVAVGQTVRKMVRRARIANQQAGITGALLVDSQSFSQVLEGPVRAVKELFGRIYLDPSHKDVVLLESGFVPKREFPDWSMAYIGTLGTAEMNVMPNEMMLDKHLIGKRGSATLRLMLYVLQANQDSLLPQVPAARSTPRVHTRVRQAAPAEYMYA